jgi:hypothetical protein
MKAKNSLSALFIKAVCCVAVSLHFFAAPAAAAQNSDVTPKVKVEAAAMIKAMKIAVSSDTSSRDRVMTVHKLKQLIQNLNPAEKSAVTDELIAMLDLATRHQLPTVRAFEMPTFIVALSGLNLLLAYHPEPVAGLKPGAAIVALGGAVYVRHEYLSPENVSAHATQLREELMDLRRAL